MAQAYCRLLPSGSPIAPLRRPPWIITTTIILFVQCLVLTLTTSTAEHPYNESVAKQLIDFSAAAYFIDSEGWKCTACQRHPEAELIRFSNSTTGAKGYVAVERDNIIVTFSGTDPLDFNAWITNVDWATVPLEGCPNCNIHRGFHTLYYSVADDLIQAIKFALHFRPGGSLYLTGHSLGGALASVCAADLHFNHGILPTALYTFGMPRVGDANFADAIKTELGSSIPVYRVVHYKDPIPHFPPLLVGFVHYPTEIFYNQDETEYSVCSSSGEDLTCSDSFLLQYQPDDHLTYLGVAV